MIGTPKLTIFILGGLAVIVASLSWSLRRRRLESQGEGASSGAIVVISNWAETAASIWLEIRSDERRLMQVIIGAASVVVSLSLGTIYVNQLWINGWQLWTWLSTLAIMLLVLVPQAARRSVHLSGWKGLLALLAAAFLLRVLFLSSIPGQLHVDELGSADFPMRHVFPQPNLTINPFVTGNSSQPVLYQYLLRLSIAVAGYSIAGIRLSSAIAGSLAVIATYVLIHLLQGRRTAMFTAALMTTYHFHIHWSRIALNNIWDTLWVPSILLLFVWGWRRRWSGAAALSGLAMGLSQYFYAGSKVAVFLLVYTIIMTYRQEPDRRRLLIYLGKFLVVAAAVALPLGIFAASSPELYFKRTQDVFGWSRGNITNTIGQYDLWRYFWHQIWRNLGAFTSVTEVTGFYGPNVPFLIGLAAPLFIIGFLWSLWQRQLIPIMWILLTVLFGGILLGGAPSSSHYVVSIPAICWLTAVPLNWLWQRGRWRLSLVLLAGIMFTDLFFYFLVYVPGTPRDLIYPLPPLP